MVARCIKGHFPAKLRLLLHQSVFHLRKNGQRVRKQVFGERFVVFTFTTYKTLQICAITKTNLILLIKLLCWNSSQIDRLARINHKNFVNLIGYCMDDKPFSRMMVFEYAPNGTLFEHLHGNNHHLTCIFPGYLMSFH